LKSQTEASVAFAPSGPRNAGRCAAFFLNWVATNPAARQIDVTVGGSNPGGPADATMPNAPIGGLIARFGDSAPVFVGQSRTFRAPRSGRLYLGVNDSYWDDNTGQYNVRVDVD